MLDQNGRDILAAIIIIGALAGMVGAFLLLRRRKRSATRRGRTRYDVR